MAKRYYVVSSGWEPGVYEDWSAAEAASSGHSPDHKLKFNSREKAFDFYIASVSGMSPKKAKIQPVDLQITVSIEVSESRDTSSNGMFPDPQMVGVSQDIGRQGEEHAFVALLDKLVQRYKNNSRLELQDIDGTHFVHSGKRVLAAIRWNNRDKETNRCPDISVMENDVETYWEVKSTKGYGLKFRMTPNEWNLAKEKGDQFYILRVCRVETDQPTIHEIHNPYQLSLEKAIKVKGFKILEPMPPGQTELEKTAPDEDVKHTRVVSKFQPTTVEPVKLDTELLDVNRASVCLQQNKKCRIVLGLFILIISIVLVFWGRMRRKVSK